MRDVLITGTDTGVGKTVIAAALIKALRTRGVPAVGFKPAETGLTDMEASDSVLLQRASGDATPLAMPLLQLVEPLAPAVAAARAGSTIDPDEIELRIELLRSAGYTVVVEGAGGLMAPLAWKKGVAPGPFSYTVLDLAQRCGLEAIIVARAGLGTLNHIALTVAMLRGRNVPVRAVVLNGGPSSQTADLAEITNADTLAQMLPDLRIVSVPRHGGADAIDATVAYLDDLLR